MEKYSRNKLVKTSVKKVEESNLYEIRPRKTFFGMTTQKEGVYYKFSDLEAELGDKYFIKEGKVFVKPKVKLFFDGGCNFEKHFESHSQAIKYEKSILSLPKDAWIDGK